MRSFSAFMLAAATTMGLATATLPARAASPACEAKRAEIESSLADAQAHGNARQVRGLKRALGANQAHCTDASLAKERDREIRDAQREVAQREGDLQSAQRKGDADKIRTRQAKLDEARADLERVQKPLPQ